MKWIIFILIGLTAIIVLMALVGAMLPKAHTATRQARFRQTPEAIFAVISKPPDYGSGDSTPYELVESDPPRRMVIRIADASLPYSGTWTFELSGGAVGESVLRITENGEVGNPIFRSMSKFIFGHTATIEKYLKSLGARFMETVTVEE